VSHAPTAADDAASKARRLSEQTRTLQEDVAATARELVKNPEDYGAQARTRLRSQESRANELAGEAEQLPEGDASRDALVPSRPPAEHGAINAAREHPD